MAGLVERGEPKLRWDLLHAEGNCIWVPTETQTAVKMADGSTLLTEVIRAHGKLFKIIDIPGGADMIFTVTGMVKAMEMLRKTLIGLLETGKE